jgi:hypothetical protein
MSYRTRQELLSNNLMELIDNYPDQLRAVIDELVTQLDNIQMSNIEIFLTTHEEET